MNNTVIEEGVGEPLTKELLPEPPKNLKDIISEPLYKRFIWEYEQLFKSFKSTQIFIEDIKYFKDAGTPLGELFIESYLELLERVKNFDVDQQNNEIEHKENEYNKTTDITPPISEKKPVKMSRVVELLKEHQLKKKLQDNEIVPPLTPEEKVTNSIVLSKESNDPNTPPPPPLNRLIQSSN